MCSSDLIVTASEDAPIHDDAAFMEYFLNHVDFSRDVFITEGIVDALDHSAIQKLYGGKIGIDISHPIEGEPGFGDKTDEKPHSWHVEWVVKELAMLDSSIVGCEPFGLKLKNPVLILKIFKKNNPHIGKLLSEKIFDGINLRPFKAFVLVDEKNHDLKDYHKIMWRVFNNTDGLRDVFRNGDRILIDATYKIPEEGYDREWPDDLEMSPEVVQKISACFSEDQIGRAHV